MVMVVVMMMNCHLILYSRLDVYFSQASAADSFQFRRNYQIFAEHFIQKIMKFV